MGVRVIAFLFVAGLGLAGPAAAQSFGDALSGIAQGLLQQELDRSAYGEAQRQNTAEAYRDYLRNFPRGAFRADAERALARLTVAPLPAPVPTPAPLPAPDPNDPAVIEAGLNLTRSQRQQIQQQLTRLGHDTRGADGVWGRNTRNAIAGWQGTNRLPATGYVTPGQVRLIAAQEARLPPVPAPAPVTPPSPAPAPPPSATAAEQIERALGLSISERREIQLRLTLLGHDTRGTAGDFDANTRSALRAWQRSQGDAVTGFITGDQIRALQRQTRG